MCFRIMSVEKFDSFLRAFLQMKKHQFETLSLVDRMKEEMEISREVETNLRYQLTRAQDRSIALQRDLNALKTLTITAKNHEKKIFEEGEVIRELQQIIADLQVQVRKKVSFATLEKEQVSKITNLDQQLKEQDGKFQFMKIEHQIALKEKDNMIAQLQESLQMLKSNYEKMQLDYDMMKNDLSRTHLLYTKKIMDYEETIRQYARDRKEILGEDIQESLMKKGLLLDKTDSVKVLWDKKLNVTWADAARNASLCEEDKALQDNEVSSQTMRDLGEHPRNKTIAVKQNYCDSHARESLQNVRPKFKPKVKTSHLKASVSKSTIITAEARPLNVLVPNQSKKKRLYSSNSNHFIL